MKVYSVNKKLKNSLASKSHRFSPDWNKTAECGRFQTKWETYKKKRWILCYGGAILPFIVYIVYYLIDIYVMKTPVELAIFRSMAVSLCVGIVTWSIAIINYKVMLFNCGYVENDGYDTELVLYDDKFIFSDTPDKNGVHDKLIVYYSSVKEIYYNKKAYTLHIRCDYQYDYYREWCKINSSPYIEDDWRTIPMYFNDYEKAVENITKCVGCEIKIT